MCCRVLGITELEKPPGKWCPNCNIGKGCNIYPDRPNSCRVFDCLWLQDETIPDSLRPDKTKVVLWMNPETENRIIASVDSTRPDAYLTGEVGRFLQNIANSGIVVSVEVDGKRSVLEGRTQNG